MLTVNSKNSRLNLNSPYFLEPRSSHSAVPRGLYGPHPRFIYVNSLRNARTAEERREIIRQHRRSFRQPRPPRRGETEHGDGAGAAGPGQQPQQERRRGRRSSFLMSLGRLGVGARGSGSHGSEETSHGPVANPTGEGNQPGPSTGAGDENEGGPTSNASTGRE